MKKHKLLLLFGALITNSIVVVPIVSTNTTKSTVNDDDIKINIKSNIHLDKEGINLLKNLYSDYYRKMGVSDWHRNYDFINIDKTSKMNRVGIIEVNYCDMNYLLSSKRNFEINYFDKSFIAENAYHGTAVTSIIGTDTGINPNSNIFYAALKYKDKNNKSYPENISRFRSILDWYKSNDVNIINMSFGPQNIFEMNKIDYLNWRSIEDNFIENINESDSWKYIVSEGDKITPIINKMRTDKIYLKKLTDKYKNIFYALEIMKLASDENLLKLKGYNELIEEYATKYGMIFVKASGNENDFRKILNDTINYIRDINYEEFKQEMLLLYNYLGKDDRYSAYLAHDILKNLDKECLQQYNELKYALIYAHHNNQIVSDLFKNTKSNISYNTQLLNKFDKWYYGSEPKNVIYTGAVDAHNKPTHFSSFNNSGYAPLVSSYGEININTNNKWLELVKRFNELKTEKQMSISEKEEHEFKEHLEYLATFRGTSMSAPMMTGVLSLLQTSLNEKLTLSDALLFSTSSGNYAATTIEKAYYSDLDFNINKEFWKSNHSKNKTGFGIPKYFNMLKMIHDEKIKTVNLSPNKLSNMMGTGYNFFTIKQDWDLKHINHIERLDYKLAFKTPSLHTLIDFFEKWSAESGDSVKIKAVKSISGILAEYQSKHNNKDFDNFVDIASTLYLKFGDDKRTPRYKESTALNSPVENVYYGEYEKDGLELEVMLIMKQYGAMFDALEKEYPNSWYGSWKAIGYPDLTTLKSVFKEYYFKYIDEVAEVKYILKINE
ncbi:S8 family serine peptidase [Mycoplasma sp. Z631]|uniref:S8 family serine peptidase n=1 Tax=Mycoplasma sp. Z631 TaxID=3401685 RepID=UPI003AAC0BC8